MPRPTEYVKRIAPAVMADAMRRGGGIVAAAAEILKQDGRPISTDVIRRYLKKYPAVKAAQDEAVERNLDVAESKLLTAIKNGEDWAIKFYLETKGKSRGYCRRQEISGVAGQPVQVSIDARKWLNDQLDQMGARLQQRPEPSGTDGPAEPQGTPEGSTPTVH